MPSLPPIFKTICGPFLSARSAAEAARGITSGEGALRRLNAARLALDGTVADQLAYLEAESTLSRVFSSGLSLVTPNDVEAIIANVPLRPATREVFERLGRSADAQVKTALGLRYEAANRGAVLNDRLRKLRIDQPLLHQFANFVPVERVRIAAALKDQRARAAAIRELAAPEVLRAGTGDWNRPDIATYGFPSLDELYAHTQAGFSKLTNAQANAFADAYIYAADLFEPARRARIARFRAENPATTLGDEEVAAKIGLGRTLTSYATHVFDKEARTGYINYLAEAARVSGYSPLSHIGLPAADGNNLFMDRLRSVVGASERTPFRTLKGDTLTTPESAFRAMFPNISDEAEIRRHIALIRSAASSASDSGMWVALNPSFTDRFLMERTGIQGFVTDYAQAMDAYVLAASRQIHLDPLTQADGAWTQFINALAPVDHSMAVSMASRFRSLTGRSLMDDPAVQEFYQVSARFARRIYRATSLAYPGFAVPNALSLPMLLFPEALRSKGGWRDLLNGALLARDPAFQRILSSTGLRATMDQTEVKAAEMAARLRAASEDGDLRAGWVAVKEYSGDILSWINYIESHIVRPYSAAVGAARWVRESGFAASQLDTLSPSQRRDLIRSMVEVTEKVTILPGSANTLPIINGIRRVPIVGPLAVMFASSPSTIAGYMLTNFRQMLRGPNRAGAARVFGAQLFFGTLIAGPFWFFPFMREMQKLPGFTDSDSEAFIGALNSWERRFSFAGWTHSDLARRLNPLTGVAERFTGEQGLSQIALGPLGRPIGDAYDALVMGDEPAKRRMAGAFAPLLFDLPPSGILPSSMQVTLPAAVGLERIGRAGLSTMSDPRGYISMGPLGLPVKNPEGWRVDALGRPISPVSVTGEFRSLMLGGRDVLDAQRAAEGIRGQKRADARASVEAILRRQLLSGDVSSALTTLNENRSLRPVITVSELEREALLRRLPPQARAVYSGSLTDTLPRVRAAASRLQSGNLSDTEAQIERAVLVAGLMRLRSARQPRGVVLQ